MTMFHRQAFLPRFFSFFHSSCTLSSTSSTHDLTHIHRNGSLHMVNVSTKKVTLRSATARSTIRFPPTVLAELKQSDETQLVGPKGSITTSAIIAGVMGAKQTSLLIPLCHPLPLEDCQVRLKVVEPNLVEVECHVQVNHKTGVEMEALTGALVAALCIYDMCKALSHDIVIENTRLVEKTGGKKDFSIQKEV